MAQRIAVIPGDGIGPEVASVGVRLLSRIAELRGLGLQFDWFDFGAERYLRDRTILPDGFMDKLRREYAAVYFGAVAMILVGVNGLDLIHPDDQERVLLDFASINRFHDRFSAGEMAIQSADADVGACGDVAERRRGDSFFRVEGVGGLDDSHLRLLGGLGAAVHLVSAGSHL